MFKTNYLNYLREKLSILVPDGYKIKVIEEMGTASTDITDKFLIKCYVKFGVGSKQTNISDRINQPVMFTILSEGEDFKIAYDIFYGFFTTYSKTHDIYNGIVLWHNYNSPTIPSFFEQVGINQRTTIIMTGVVSHSKDKIIGVKYYLDDGEIPVINPQATFQSQTVAIQKIGENVGKAVVEGSNVTFSFNMLLDKSSVSMKLLDCSIYGIPYKPTLKIVYIPGVLEYNINCVVTSAINTSDTSTGDNILQVALMEVI